MNFFNDYYGLKQIYTTFSFFYYQFRLFVLYLQKRNCCFSLTPSTISGWSINF